MNQTNHPTSPITNETTTAPVVAREAHAKRRTFTAAYKRGIIAEYNQAPLGSKGEILRRERLYDSHIQEWRAALAAGTLETGARKGRPVGSGHTPEQKRILELERETARLEAVVARRDATIKERDQALDVLGKGVAFLEALSSQNAS